MNKWEKEVQQSLLDSEAAAIKELEKQYAKALKDINEKVKLFQADIDLLDQALSQDGLDDTTKALLQSQKRSKIYQQNYQQALKGQVSGILDKMHGDNYTTIDKYLNGCYETGYVGTMYSIACQGIPLVVPIDQAAAVKAVLTDSKVSNGLYSALGVNVGKLKKTITQEISRGIASSLPYSDIARNISNVSKAPLSRAKTIARTEGHRIQQTSTRDAQQAAKNKGADVLKQWDAALDGRTRDSHRRVDGEIRELDEKFSNGLMYPGDSSGSAAEVVNCRCTSNTRARWALDEDELQTLKERAEYFGLDKTKSFEEYTDKYLKASEVQAAVEQTVKPKKEYLTEKKLKQKIDNADKELADLLAPYGGDEVKFTSGASIEDQAKYLTLMDDKNDWQKKLDKKLVTKEKKKLAKEQIQLQQQLDEFEIKTYSGIWKDDVTTADWGTKHGSIAAKKKYFESKFIHTTDVAEMDKWKGFIADLDDFDTNGKAYYDLQKQLAKNTNALTNLKKSGKISAIDNALSQERKDAAYWFTDANGGVKAADGVLRDKAGAIWQVASEKEKDAIYEYTRSYHKFNEPLRGIEYGTNKFLGVGNVDLDKIGVNYGGYKVGEVRNQIDAITSIIDKSTYDFDIWVQRGCGRSGMDKFFGIDINDFDLPEAELAAKLVGTQPTEYAFMSTGVAKGKGLNTSGGILLNVYAPAGTKMMYLEPISAFGRGDGRSWDGISPQSSFGYEAEMLLQRGTKFNVTKVEKNGNTIYVDVEIIGQELN